MGLPESVVEGRATADRKFEIVDRLEKAGRRVLMVGDGANDCKALQRATSSLALTRDREVESSASLRSDRKDLGVVLDVLNEGRSYMVRHPFYCSPISLTCHQFIRKPAWCTVVSSLVVVDCLTRCRVGCILVWNAASGPDDIHMANLVFGGYRSFFVSHFA